MREQWWSGGLPSPRPRMVGGLPTEEAGSDVSESETAMVSHVASRAVGSHSGDGTTCCVLWRS
jgi:hypothetical protein